MTRRLMSVLVVGSVLVTAAAVSPALVAGHAGGRPGKAQLAMPGWAAGLASKMFGSTTQPQRPRVLNAPRLPPLAGTTCYAAGGSVCAAPPCTRFAAGRPALHRPSGPARSCTRPVKPLVPKAVPIRVP